MKKLKLDHAAAQLVADGRKTSTWRLFDDKDLSVDDSVLLIDKIIPEQPDTWRTIGTAIIDRITVRRLQDIGATELDGSEGFTTMPEMLAAYRKRYGESVTMQTPVKIIDFHLQSANRLEETRALPRQPGTCTLYADGGSRGNPGPSAAGYVLYDAQHTIVATEGTYLGVTTNNQAEYTALKLGLEAAKARGVQDVRVYMDSMLVINQMKGVFKIKNRELWPLHDAAQALAHTFRHISFTQIPRELNKVADAAVNTALDDQLQHAASPK